MTKRPAYNRALTVCCATILAITALACGDVQTPVLDKLAGAKVLSAPPQNPNVEQFYLFYQHGKIVEGSDGHPVHPRFGPYEYEDILSTLSAAGFVVISGIRPRDADVSHSAASLKAGVESLLEAGVPPSHITLLGASKGGVITIRASNMLKNRALKVVILAGFFGGLKEDPKLQPWGAVLSIHDSSDQSRIDPAAFLRNADGVSEQRIVVTETGLGHGLLFSPHEAWLNEVVQWSGIQD